MRGEAKDGGAADEATPPPPSLTTLNKTFSVGVTVSQHQIGGLPLILLAYVFVASAILKGFILHELTQ